MPPKRAGSSWTSSSPAPTPGLDDRAVNWAAVYPFRFDRLARAAQRFAAAIGVMWFTQAGRDFLVFSRESWDEAKRVVWPSRKETLQTTGIVFVFVFVMALFLWGVDAGLLWVTQRLLGQGG